MKQHHDTACEEKKPRLMRAHKSIDIRTFKIENSKDCYRSDALYTKAFHYMSESRKTRKRVILTQLVDQGRKRNLCLLSAHCLGGTTLPELCFILVK